MITSRLPTLRSPVSVKYTAAWSCFSAGVWKQSARNGIASFSASFIGVGARPISVSLPSDGGVVGLDDDAEVAEADET